MAGNVSALQDRPQRGSCHIQMRNSEALTKKRSRPSQREGTALLTQVFSFQSVRLTTRLPAGVLHRAPAGTGLPGVSPDVYSQEPLLAQGREPEEAIRYRGACSSVFSLWPEVTWARRQTAGFEHRLAPDTKHLRPISVMTTMMIMIKMIKIALY